MPFFHRMKLIVPTAGIFLSIKPFWKYSQIFHRYTQRHHFIMNLWFSLQRRFITKLKFIENRKLYGHAHFKNLGKKWKIWCLSIFAFLLILCESHTLYHNYIHPFPQLPQFHIHTHESSSFSSLQFYYCYL